MFSLNGEFMTADEGARRLKCRVAVVEVTRTELDPYTLSRHTSKEIVEWPETASQALIFTDRTGYKVLRYREPKGEHVPD